MEIDDQVCTIKDTCFYSKEFHLATYLPANTGYDIKIPFLYSLALSAILGYNSLDFFKLFTNENTDLNLGLLFNLKEIAKFLRRSTTALESVKDVSFSKGFDSEIILSCSIIPDENSLKFIWNIGIISCYEFIHFYFIAHTIARMLCEELGKELDEIEFRMAHFWIPRKSFDYITTANLFAWRHGYEIPDGFNLTYDQAVQMFTIIKTTQLNFLSNEDFIGYVSQLPSFWRNAMCVMRAKALIDCDADLAVDMLKRVEHRVARFMLRPIFAKLGLVKAWNPHQTGPRPKKKRLS